MTSESPFFTVTPEEKAVKMEIKNYYDLQTALRKLAQDREGSGTAALRSGESRSRFHDQRGMRHARAGRAAPARPALELAWRQEARRGVCGPGSSDGWRGDRRGEESESVPLRACDLGMSQTKSSPKHVH